MDLVSQNLLMTSGGKKDPTYVDDVFSTYLYKGNDSSRIVSNGIKLSNANAGNSVNFANYGSLVVPTSADFKFGTGAFTIEYFIYFISSTSYISMFDGRPVSTNGNQTSMNMYTGGELNWWDLTANTAVIANQAATTLTANAWTHVAYVREGTGANQAKMYFNGSLVATGTDPQDYAINQLNRIGGQPWSPGVGNFSISNYRVVKGTAVYTSNFTPSTKALTNISGTVLLCCQSSSDPFAAAVTPGTITIGTQSQAVTPVAQAFGPFTGTGGEGGLLWIKNRTSTVQHQLFDTVRGANKVLKSNTNDAQWDGTGSYNQTFTSTGFTLNNSTTNLNSNNNDYTSWTFRKAKGFFDIVTYTGTGSARTIAHSLGCVPGMIIIKETSGTQDWTVYHRGTGAGNKLKLNTNDAAGSTGAWNSVTPTNTHFSLGGIQDTNKNGESFVAYLFAGGESTAATARSVDYDGSGDYLTQTCDAVLKNWWDQAFTVEYWINPDGFVSSGNGGPGVLGVNAPTSNGETWSFGPKSNGTVEFYYWNGSIQQVTTTKILNLGQWYHLAMVYDGSSSIKIYINGTLEKSATKQGTPTGSSTVFSIGKVANGSEFNGRVSNVRITHQALYTSSFRPSTKPLTTTSQGATGSNVKLLCCNNSSVTGSTVTPASITANGDPTASTDSPFDDPAGFKFGEEGDQDIIKCGSYVGNGAGGWNDGPKIDLGWEPQYILIKNASSGANWSVIDSMRGISTNKGSNANYGQDSLLFPDASGPEVTSTSTVNVNLLPRGFDLTSNSSIWNSGSATYIYIAIRRPDPLVATPIEDATKVFAMDVGSGSGSNNTGNIPMFDSNFVVDYNLSRQPATATQWLSSSRLTGQGYVATETTDPEYDNDVKWDSNVGWCNRNIYNSSFQSWMWKRHPGFDVVNYTGNGLNNRQLIHSLNKTPEMIWSKSRTQSEGWPVWHKDLSTNEFLRLHTADTAGYNNAMYEGNPARLPTSIDWQIGNSDWINKNNEQYVSMLFASVVGISKVSSYAGSDSALTITTGFRPRFLIIKNITDARNWTVVDTTRGWGAGNDCRAFLDLTESQICSSDVGAPTSTGFTLTTANIRWNIAGHTYIYYAHA